MASDTSEKGGEWGPFERGGAYKEVGPELGSLHDAWDVETGKPAVMLLPTELVKWQLEGSWRVSLLCSAQPPSVTVRVEEAPASVRVSELADILVLTTAAFTRAEDSAHLQAHLASGISPPRSTPRRSSRFAALRTGLALGLCVGALMSLSEAQRPLARDEASTSRERASSVAELEGQDPATLSYEMPEKPFRNQVLPPCKERKVEINGGCWSELAQRPPCDSDSAEHQGKCFMPVPRLKAPPTAVGP